MWPADFGLAIGSCAELEKPMPMPLSGVVACDLVVISILPTWLPQMAPIVA